MEPREYWILGRWNTGSTKYQCCGSGVFFSAVFKIRIRIRVTPKRPDPTGSGSYLDTFLMNSKINNVLLHFYTNSKHLMTHKFKDKKLF